MRSKSHLAAGLFRMSTALVNMEMTFKGCTLWTAHTAGGAAEAICVRDVTRRRRKSWRPMPSAGVLTPTCGTCWRKPRG